MSETQVAPALSDSSAPVESTATPEVHESVETKPKEDTDLAKRFTILSRKEAQLRAKEQQMKEEAKKYEAYEQAKAQAKLNPIQYLEAIGLSYDQITDFILNDNKPTTESKLEALERQLQEEREAREAIFKKLEEEKKEIELKTSKETEEKVIQEYKSSIRDLVANSEDFELMQKNGDDALELAYYVAEDYFEKTGEILSPEKAARQVEEHFEEQLRETFLKTKKASILLSKDKQTQSPEETPAKTPGFTLTNSATAFTPAEPLKQRLSEEESKRRAAKVLEEYWAQNK